MIHTEFTCFLSVDGKPKVRETIMKLVCQKSKLCSLLRPLHNCQYIGRIYCYKNLTCLRTPI